MPAWAVTANHERFDEALTWFSQRVVITAETAATLDLDSRQRAFWVGGGLQIEQIQGVFAEIKKSIDSGEPFEDFRKRVRKTLRNDAHAETVFRNAVQRAYNAGRHRQMSEPDVAKFRPYWMFDAVLDGRTTQLICRPRDKTLLPHDHEFWQSNVPPLHHRCRSSLRNLRKAEAERRGVTNVPPVLPETPGWGNPPNKAPIWKPDPKKHDPKLVKELEKKKAKADKRPAPPPPPAKSKPEHDPKFWEQEYAHLGEAAPCAAWGRAMLERGLDRSAAEVLAEYERLRAAKHPGCIWEIDAWFKKLDPNAPLRDTVVGKGLRQIVAFTEHTRSIEPAADFVATEGGGGTGASHKAVQAAERFYRMSLDRSVRTPKGVHVDIGKRGPDGKGVRAYASVGEFRDDNSYGPRIVLDQEESDAVAVHEIAHQIEYADTRAVARSRAFLLARTKGETRKRMRDITGSDDYGEKEVAWEDKFWNPYIGKDYGDSATEVTSMGYQRMVENLIWYIRKDASQPDEEALFFMLGQLAGK